MRSIKPSNVVIIKDEDYAFYLDKAQEEIKQDYKEYQELLLKYPDAKPFYSVIDFRIQQWHIVNRELAFRAILTREEPHMFLALEKLVLN